LTAIAAALGVGEPGADLADIGQVHGGVPVFVRRPVDAAAVRRADTRAGRVGDVGLGHANNAGACAAGDDQNAALAIPSRSPARM
jgi:hypothetical protein